MRGGGPAEAKRSMPREGLCRILSWFSCSFREIGKGTGTCQEGGLSAAWTALLQVGFFEVVFHDRRAGGENAGANGEIAACKHHYTYTVRTNTACLAVGTSSNDSRGQNAPSIADRANNHRAGNCLSSVPYTTSYHSSQDRTS